MEPATAATSQPPLNLLNLPDKALATVLRCLAADSLFSAARAHSTLHQLSAAALSSIETAATQQQVASLQLYLSRHSRHVKGLRLHGGPGRKDSLNELLQGLQLNSLSVTGYQLQLLPGGGRAGVLRPGAPLKRLEISNCAMRDVDCPPDAAFAQALSQLPQLEHIKHTDWGATLCFPGHVLSGLQQLTSLDVINAAGDVLEFVTLAPGLRDLRARLTETNTTAKLSALRHLTSLQLESVFEKVCFNPADLANKSHLQRLQINGATLAGGPAALLSQLQQMTQLTHLALQRCWDLCDDRGVPYSSYDPSGPPAAAYAALTASSTLQHLDISGNTMPEGIWQHMLPTDRHLPELRVLHASQWSMLGCWTHADTPRLISCCPNLQELSMRTQQPMAADMLHPLRALTALTALVAGELDDAGLAAAAELTQLRQLRVWKQESATDAGLLQLTQLRQMSKLSADWYHATALNVFEDQEPEGEPVWRQVLQRCLESQQPGVAQQAAASLEQLVL